MQTVTSISGNVYEVGGRVLHKSGWIGTIKGVRQGPCRVWLKVEPNNPADIPVPEFPMGDLIPLGGRYAHH